MRSRLFFECPCATCHCPSCHYQKQQQPPSAHQAAFQSSLSRNILRLTFLRLLFSQLPHLTKSLHSEHFYAINQLLARNNTIYTQQTLKCPSPPRQRCSTHLQELRWNQRLFLRFFLSPMLIPSCQLTCPCQDTSSRHCCSQFRIYFSKHNSPV